MFQKKKKKKSNKRKKGTNGFYVLSPKCTRYRAAA